MNGNVSNQSFIIEVKIPTKSIIVLLRKFNAIKTQQWLIKSFRLCGHQMLASIQANFTNERFDEKWASWSPRYAQFRKAVGDETRILTLTGKYVPAKAYNHSEKYIKKHKIQSGKKNQDPNKDTNRVRVYDRQLSRSFSVMDDTNTQFKETKKSTMMMIGTNLIYAPVHQFGSKKLHIPARPYLGFHPADIIVFKAIFNKTLQDTIDAA